MNRKRDRAAIKKFLDKLEGLLLENAKHMSDEEFEIRTNRFVESSLGHCKVYPTVDGCDIKKRKKK